MARFDLRLPFTPMFPPSLFGGIDTKCLRQREAVMKLAFHAQAAPAWDEVNGVPVFEWDYPPEGLPKRWDFGWVTFESQETDKCAGISKKGECKDTSGCGWCGGGNRCLAGDGDGAFFWGECESGWSVKSELASWVIPVSVVGGVVVIGIVVGGFVGWYWVRRRRGREARSTLLTELKST
jgi:hypothetical protein